MASLAHNLRTEANVASEEKTIKKKNTQRWTGLSEWRGNRAVGLLLHSGTLSTTTTTTKTHRNDTCIRELTGLWLSDYIPLPINYTL